MPIIRLHKYFDIQTETKLLEDGIVIVVEHHGKQICLFVDEIIGQQQTVIKPLSDYFGTIKGLSGCSILSTGDISLILDIQQFVKEFGDQKTKEKTHG